MNSGIKTVIKIVAAVIFLSGGVWFLQGINVLPGSSMSGNPQWVINGAIGMVIGAGLFWYGTRSS